MTPERAKLATPAQPRSLPKPFPEAPHHQPTTKYLQKQARKCPQTKPETPIPLSHKFTANCGKRYTQFCRIKGCGGAGYPIPMHTHTHTHTPIIFQRLKLPPANYISSEREFTGESESFKISGKYFDFAIL